MNKKARQEVIIDYLREHKRLTVEYLSKQLDASQETIRRDLTILVEAGKIERVHGGAQLPRIKTEATFARRLNHNEEDKRKVAIKAASLLSPGDSLFIDTGSTTFYFAQMIADINELTVITNSCDVARIIQSGSGHSSVFLLGGEYNPDNNQTLGHVAIEQTQQYRVQYAFITAGGLDIKNGVSDFSIEEAQLAKAMLKNADERIVIIDQSKLNRTVTHQVCDLVDVSTLVTNAKVDKLMQQALNENHVQLITAQS